MTERIEVFLLENMGGREAVFFANKVKLHFKSFFQVNPIQMEVLYNQAIKAANLSGNETCIDMYAGTGTIGMAVSKHAKSVIGVEIVKEAVDIVYENEIRLEALHFREQLVLITALRHKLFFALVSCCKVAHYSAEKVKKLFCICDMYAICASAIGEKFILNSPNAPSTRHSRYPAAMPIRIGISCRILLYT